MGNTASDENRGAATAVTGTTRPFLAVDFGTGLVNFRTTLSAMRASTGICQLTYQSLVHQTTMDLCVKDASGHLNATYFFTGHVKHWYFHECDLSALLFCGLPQNDETTFRTRNRTFNSDEMPVCIDAHYLKILGSEGFIAHPTRHSFPFEYMGRSRCGANRTRCPMAIRLAVSLYAPAKAIPLDHTGKPSPFRLSRHVYPITRPKLIYRQRLANLMLAHSLSPKLTQVSDCWDISVTFTTGMLMVWFQETKVTTLTFTQSLFFNVSKAELDSVVAIGLLCLDLCYIAGTSLDDGNRCHNTIVIKDLGHSHFYTQ